MMEKVRNNIPKLRFPEFSGEWREESFDKFYEFKSTNSYSRDQLNYESGEVYNIHYGDIHTKFRSRFYLQREDVPFINQVVNIDKITEDKFCEEGDLVIADASEDYDDIGKTIELINLNGKRVLAGLHTLLARRINDDIFVGFGAYLMANGQVRKQIKLIAQGTKVLGISTGRVNKIKLKIPKPEEQQKIASFLSSVDKKIEQLAKKKQLLEQYKKGMMQKLFSRQIRFKDENGNNYPDWGEKKLGDVLDYEQPTKYLVKSSEYSDEYDVPVLTAGKTFLLGYTNEKYGIFESDLPTIIFDDFTTAFQYVTFSFKAKSSAMKMLIPKQKDINIRFIYEVMKNIKFPLGEHKRYWISEYSKEKIPYPSPKEQTKIANFLSSIDDKINLIQNQLTKAKTFKKGLLQQMFV